jgi:hypothetical protein
MARFSSMLCGSFIFIGALTLQAQTMRPTMPVQRPNPPGSLAPQTPQQTPSPQSPTGVPTPATGSGQIAQPAVQPGPLGPPVAPVVTYRDGLLSVQALNSNLSSVVTAIRNKTGIEFEGAEGISERVAIALGPAPEGDVLAAIFSGSKYDFLAIGRADSPTIVQKVILTVKNKPGAPGEAQAQQQKFRKNSQMPASRRIRRFNLLCRNRLHKLRHRLTNSRRHQNNCCKSCRKCVGKKVLRKIQRTIRIRPRGRCRRDRTVAR